MAELAEGLRVEAEGTGLFAEVGPRLGEGTQGIVHRAELAGRAVALKWYRREYLPHDPGLRDRLTEAIRRGTPGRRFLWPLALAVAPGRPGFGYLMPLREPRFAGMDAVIAGREAGRVLRPGLRVLARAGHLLSDALLDLHAAGLCYRDISFGNVFVDPQLGEVLVCDNDNVAPAGQRGPVAGTPSFMAPELLRGAALPSVATDLFSLAVLLFRLLLRAHPLDGARAEAVSVLDAAAQRRLYGEDPLFVFDAANTANAPDPRRSRALHAGWEALPETLRALFRQAFGPGLANPGARPLETAWCSALSRLHDLAQGCGCGGGGVLDAARAAADPGWAPRCWSCGKALPRLPHLVAEDGAATLLIAGDRLHPHHLGATRSQTAAPVAEVVAHPARPGELGLRNLGATPWQAWPPGGAAPPAAIAVPPGRAVSLLPGLRLAAGGPQVAVRR